MKEFDSTELAQYNGENGKPIYIAHAGKVYDVSESKLWRNGLHMKRHSAGTDLTTDIQAAPHESDVLAKYPQVGILKKEVIEQEMPAALNWLLKKLSGRFRSMKQHLNLHDRKQEKIRDQQIHYL